MKYGSFNHLNLPPWVVGSHHFNDYPKKLTIAGVRENNRFLFDRLDGIDDRKARSEFFCGYMTVRFNLHRAEEQNTDYARQSIKNSYQRFLKGWMIDSNSAAGAVLKHWTERRTGITPTYHNGLIEAIDTENYYRYMQDALNGSQCTGAIDSQLDLLYEYCQYELYKKHSSRTLLTLYRGTHDAEEYEILENLGNREQIVRLNNLVSFTNEAERAWEFGRTVWRTAVPLSKIFFYSGLLQGSIMKGENEFIIIGGQYRVKRMR